MLDFLFGKKKPPEPEHAATVRLNARLEPVDRGEHFEDPLNVMLREMGKGKVSGGGTGLGESGEVSGCDLELRLHDVSESTIQFVVASLNRLGAPKGSILTMVGSGQEFPVGKAEGLAVYLNGTDLPDEVYSSCDSHFVFAEFERLLGDSGEVMGTWYGSTEVGFYIYGTSYATMRARLEEFLANYPLCQRCRVVQIA
jgi:hypothetical protein